MVSFETIRFPIIFGSFLIAAGSAYIFREHLIPNLEDEKKKLFQSDEKTKEAIFNAIKSIKDHLIPYLEDKKLLQCDEVAREAIFNAIKSVK